MFRKILVALDHSEHSRFVLDAAISLARSTQAELRLLHVLTSNEDDYPNYTLAQLDVGFVLDEEAYQEGMQRYAQDWREFESHHLALLEDLARTATEQGIQTHCCQAYGNPGKEICEMAKTWQADAIVLGRRGRSRLTEALLGSVSNYVVHHAPCAVLVVQGQTSANLDHQNVTQNVTQMANP